MRNRDGSRLYNAACQMYDTSNLNKKLSLHVIIPKAKKLCAFNDIKNSPLPI